MRYSDLVVFCVNGSELKFIVLILDLNDPLLSDESRLLRSTKTAMTSSEVNQLGSNTDFLYSAVIPDLLTMLAGKHHNSRTTGHHFTA